MSIHKNRGLSRSPQSTLQGEVIFPNAAATKNFTSKLKLHTQSVRARADVEYVRDIPGLPRNKQSQIDFSCDAQILDALKVADCVGQAMWNCRFRKDIEFQETVKWVFCPLGFEDCQLKYNSPLEVKN